MRKSFKIAAWTGIPAFFIQWAANLNRPSQNEVNRWTDQMILEYNAFWEPIGLLVAILVIVAVPAFIYGIYRNIVEARQTVVTNIGGDNINAASGAVVAARNAKVSQVNTGAIVSGNDIDGLSLNEALDALLETVKRSDLGQAEKMQARGLAEEIKDKQAKGHDDETSTLVKDLLVIAKDMGPAVKGVSEAVTTLGQWVK